MKQNTSHHGKQVSLRRSFLSCLLAVLMIVTLLPVSALTAKAEEGIIYTITLVANDPGYLFDEYGTPVYQKTLQSDGSAVVLDVPVYPEGYTFTGWFADPGCTLQAAYDANMMFVPAELNTVLYAGYLAPDPAVTEEILTEEPEETLEPIVETVPEPEYEEDQEQDPDTQEQGSETGSGEDELPAATSQNEEENDTEVQDETEEADSQDEADLIPDDTENEAVAVTPKKTARPLQSINNDELFEDYLEEEVFGLASAPAVYSNSRLSDPEATIYQKLRGYIAEVAAGTRPSTVFEIPVEEMGFEKTSWTAEELGLETLFSGGQLSPEASEEVEKRTNYDLNQILNALLADCPYELYWYNKTGGTVCDGMEMYASGNEIGVQGTVSFSFSVAPGYGSNYTVDTAAVEKAQAAALYAQSIVDANANLGDREKLVAYKNSICDLASYNDDAAAAAGETITDGNPWQLVWVFDNDPNTSVVCEGYSKAFQYLVNLSSFSNTTCDLVSGTMYGGTGQGRHMWNIVHMDGRNYLVDVTNCDEGTAGYPDQLFLATPASGDVNSEYTFYCNDDQSGIEYVYDTDTRSYYSNAELILSEEEQSAVTITLHAAPQGYFLVTDENGDPIHKDTISLTCHIGDNVDVSQQLSGVEVCANDEDHFWFNNNWYTSETEQNESKLANAFTVTGDRELFAGWEKIWTVTLKTDTTKGYYESDTPDTYLCRGKEGDSLETWIPAPLAWSNYRLIGWLDSSNTLIDTSACYPVGGETFTASWEHVWNLELDANGGYFWGDPDNTSSFYSVPDEVTITNAVGWIPDPETAEQKVFLGWSEEKDGSTGYFDLSVTLNSDKILYAQWAPAWKVTLDAGENGYVTEKWQWDYELKWEEYIEAENLYQQKYDAYWNTPEEERTEALYNDMAAAQEARDQALAAYDQAQQDQTGQTIYEQKLDILVKQGESIDLSEYPAYAYEDKPVSFDGWYLNDKKQETVFKPTENVLLTAGYTKAHTVVLNSNSPANETRLLKVPEGKSIGDYLEEWYSPSYGSDDPGIHMDFVIWTTEQDGTGTGRYTTEEMRSIVPTEEMDDPLTFYAQWEQSYGFCFEITGNDGFFNFREEEGQMVYDRDEWYFPGMNWEGSVYSCLPTVLFDDGQKKAVEGLYWEETCSSDSRIDEDDNIRLSQNKTVYVKTAAAYEITFDANGIGYFREDPGEDGEPIYIRTATYMVVPGNAIGYSYPGMNYDYEKNVLTGWKVSGDDSGEIIQDLSQYVPKGDVTLTAQWKQAYELVCDAGKYGFFSKNDDNTYNTVSTSYISEGETVNIYNYMAPPEMMEGSKKAFTGWFYDEECTERVPDNESFEMTEDLTVYAGWGDTYEIRFHGGEGYFQGAYDEETQSYEQLDLYTVNVLKDSRINDVPYVQHNNEHYEFLRQWTTSPAGAEDAAVYTSDELCELIPTGDMDLYPCWKVTRLVTFHANGGYFNNDPDQTEIKEHRDTGEKIYSCSYSLQNENDDKVFLGWNYDQNAEQDESVFPITVEDQDINLYAVWTSDYYNITFNAGDGVFSGERKENSVKVPYGRYIGSSDYETPRTAETGKAFAGWRKAGDTAVISESEIYRYVPKGDTEFTAVWSDAWILTLEANDPEAWFRDWGTGALSKTKEVTVPKDEEMQAYLGGSDLVSIREDNTNTTKVLTGWNTEANGSGTAYAVNSVLKVMEDLILFAQWEEGCEIVLHSGDNGYFPGYGTNKTEITALRQRGKLAGYVLEPSPVDETQIFIGWAEKSGGEVKYADLTGYTVPDLDTIELWAVYGDREENEITITFESGDDAHFGYYGDNYETYPCLYRKGIRLGETSAVFCGEHLIKENNAAPYMAFAGWAASKNGEKLSDDFVLNESMTLYPLWEAAYKITLDAQQGHFLLDEEPSEYSFFVLKGNTLQESFAYTWPDLYVISKEMEYPDDLAFMGWNTKQDGTGEFVRITRDWKPEADMTLYAVYSSFNMYGRPSVISVNIGDSKDLLVYIEPTSIMEAVRVTWTSGDETIVTVDDKGSITALKPGQTTVTAAGTYNGKPLEVTYSVFVKGDDVESVELEPTSAALEVGAAQQLTATVLPDTADNKTVSWSSSDDAVATVDQNGLVTAVSVGTATITVTAEDGNKTASCEVTVVEKIIPVTGVTLTPDTAVINVGETVPLTASVSPDDASNKGVSWSSSDTAIATVDKDGVVTGVAEGTVTITVTTADGNKTAACEVTVKAIPVESISLNKTETTLQKDTIETLTVTITPENATYRDVTWSSSDPNVAAVDENGNVTAVGGGTAAITVTSNKYSEKTAACTVTVIVPVTGITLSETAKTVYAGDEFTLTETVIPNDATNKTVRWETSDSSVAAVQSGVVTAHKAGTARITVVADDHNWSASCDVTVQNRPVTDVTLDKTTLQLNKGDKDMLTATVLPENATIRTVAWSSSNTDAVTVDENGNITAVGGGTATITVTTDDGQKTAACVVTVIVPVTGVTLDKSSADLKIGKTVELTESVEPADATDKAVTWSSSDTSIATVNENGVVTGVAEGTATITVTTADGSKTADCTVSVTPINVTEVTLEPASAEVIAGKTVTLTATVEPADATNQAVTWSSSDTAIATVNENGVVTGVAKGTATITVTTVDGSKTAASTITVYIPVTGVTLDKTNETLTKGSTETLQLTATIEPADANNQSVTWNSSDPNVAAVDENGNVTAVGGGTATITVTTNDGQKTASCEVTVIVPVTGVTLDKSSADLKIGNTVELTETVKPADATDKAVTWSSSDTAIATVNENGAVTGVAEGTATITVTTADGGKTAECTVSVTPINVTGVALKPAEAKVPVGQTVTLKAAVEPADATNQAVNWSSSDTATATVDQNGVVTGMAEGTATITVTTADGNKTAVSTVKVYIPVTGVSLDKTKESLTMGSTETLQLTAAISPANATDKTVTWTSSNTAVATVDTNGKVTAKGPGTATITVKTTDGGKTASCKVTVTQPVSSVSLNKTSQSMKTGETATLTAAVSPANASNKKVTWTSSNTAVATVDANGKVTAKGPGSATITAKTADGGKTAACKVTVTQPVSGVSLNKTSQALKPGETVSLAATVNPSNASNKKVTWTSSNTAVATVDANGKVTAKAGGTATITAKTADGGKTASCKVTVDDRTQRVPSVSYRTHVQKYGWQDYRKDGDMSGTTGESKRLEAININVSNLPYDGGITYRTHVQKYGWQNWKSNGEMAGTSGEGKRLEAIQVQLTGEMAKHYDVYYQTHIQHFGWSGWASNGEMCGSAGYAYRLEGIRIKLVKKGGAAPGSTANPFYGKAGSGSPVSKTSGALVGYNTHVQTYGWQNFVYDGAMSGTSGESKRLEGIQINLVDKPYSGDIVYRTHVQKYGWQTWKKNGEMSGTSGEAKRLEGIQIYLTGEMAKHYDVYYRVHAQTYGWLDYAKNGEMAGTSGLAKRLEGINIVLVPKGGKAPGNAARPNVVGGGGKLPDNPYKG